MKNCILCDQHHLSVGTTRGHAQIIRGENKYVGLQIFGIIDADNEKVNFCDQVAILYCPFCGAPLFEEEEKND